MSRSGYSDHYSEESPGWASLYRFIVNRSVAGARGQRFLRELAAAMDAMPEKVLITDDLIDIDGNCCTIGVVCKSRGIEVKDVDIEDPETVGKLVGISRSMAGEIEYLNDENGPYCETPEERWVRMRKWVADQLKESEATGE